MPDAEILLPSRATDAEGHRRRLRERFERGGLAAFAEHEIVELLLTLALPRRDVKPLAKTLIARFGNLRGVLEAPLDSLREVPCIGEVAPVAFRIIKAAAELYLRQGAEEEPLLNNYARLEAFWRARLGELKHEVVEIAYLDKSYRLLPQGVERLVEGSIDGVSVSLQLLMKKALGRGARYLVLAHNHPSGDLSPSEEDAALTSRVGISAKAVEIELLDHWIISSSGCYSFRRAGRCG